MRKVSLFPAIVAVLLLTFQPAKPEVKLPAIVSSNMVLQRDATVVLWGWADPNEKITIKASWLDNAINLTADKSGNWRVDVKTTKSKKEQQISLFIDNKKIFSFSSYLVLSVFSFPLS